jgi:hypothetical protein
MKNPKCLLVLLASMFGASATASAGTPLSTTVDINVANLIKSYDCDLNGYDSTGSTSSFTNCSLVSTFSTMTPADFGNWHPQLSGLGVSVNVLGCKEDAFAILGVNAHIVYICPKSP